jgi:HD-GYP domain-containing protein (c-di-GMP phosphodiesterase class II)
MRLVKLAAGDLRPGMFIAELDRPWLETPFALQGFVVTNSEEIDFVSRYVDEVYVDADYKAFTNIPRLNLDAAPTVGGNKGKPLLIKADFEQTRACFESASETMEKVFDQLRKNQTADIGLVREAVNPLIASIFRNQEAVAALVRLKESGSYRYHHGLSMAMWAVILARHIGLHRDELEKLAIGCAMCDVGMTELPETLLDQPQELDGKQRRIIHAHPKMGAQMVAESTQDVDFEILAIIENHHERMDGSGYPRGLEGASIPLLARIAGLADSYDAMITPRPYALARTSHEAAQELMDSKDKLFHGALVEQFVSAIGLFPTGTLVELNTGEVAIVTRQNETRRLKPEIVVVTDENKDRLEQVTLVDLAVQDRIGERWIARELLAGSYGIHSKEFFL